MGAHYLLPWFWDSLVLPHPKPLLFSATSLTGFPPSGMQAQLWVGGLEFHVRPQGWRLAVLIADSRAGSRCGGVGGGKGGRQ